MSDLSELAQAVFRADLAGEPYDASTVTQSEQRALAQAIADRNRPLVYTAFNGDNFWLVDCMRSYCAARGSVPANPESIIGYKDSVDRRLTKAGVMRDDLSVLRGCDDLWIFADIEPELEALATLAEGILVELCFFALSHPPFDLRLVPTRDLLDADIQESKSVRVDWHSLRRVLPSDVRMDLLNLLGGESLQVRGSLPPVIFYCYDLSDSKYVNWMRPFAYNEDLVSVVPTLAVNLNDLSSSSPNRLFDILASWASLMRLAKRAWFLPPISGGPGGPVANVLRLCWSAAASRPAGQTVDWSRLRVPKALLGTSWPITLRERHQLVDRG